MRFEMQDVREYMTTISTVVTDVRGGRLAAAAATAAAATAAVYVVAKSGSYLLGSKGGSFWGRFGFLDKYVCEFMLLMGCSFLVCVHDRGARNMFAGDTNTWNSPYPHGD